MPLDFAANHHAVAAATLSSPPLLAGPIEAQDGNPAGRGGFSNRNSTMQLSNLKELAAQITASEDLHERMREWKRMLTVIVAENTACAGPIPITRTLTDKARRFLIDRVEAGEIDILISSKEIVCCWLEASPTFTVPLFNRGNVTIETLRERAEKLGVDLGTDE